MEKLVSIIIPVYNVEKYLAKCLESILNQSYNNYEVIIINDGSTDSSKEIILEYKKLFNKMTFLEQKNMGVSVAREKALNSVNGSYLLFVDPDDYLDPYCLEKCIKEFSQSKSEIIIFGYYRITDSVKLLNGINYKEKYLSGEMAAKLLLQGKISAHLWNKAYLVDNIKNTPMHFDSGRYSQDWFPVFEQLINSKKVSIINEPLYNYIDRPGSAVSNINIKKIQDFLYATQKIQNYIQEKNIHFDKNTVLAFCIMRFNSTIAWYSKIRLVEGRKLYKSINQHNFNFIEPTFKDVLLCKYSSYNVKLSILAWKLKIRHLLKSK